MKHSEQLNELAAAMSKLQGEIKDADKDTSGYGYKYADLSQVLSIIRPLLSKYGLSFTQHVSNADDKISVETMVLHSSGQWMSSEISLPPVASKSMNAAQAVGSVITYGRRYALTAIFGITQTDDDAASDNKSAQQGYAKPEQKTKPYVPKDFELSGEKYINPEQVINISKLVYDAKLDEKEFLESFGVATLGMITSEFYPRVVKKLEMTIETKKKPSGVDYMSV